MFQFDAVRIHEASLTILQDVGVAFHSRKAIDIFKHHGIKTDGNLVFIQPDQVQKALDSAPSDFILHGRNPEKNVTIGSGDWALAPGYGAPHLMTPSGRKRNATLEDYQRFCKLIQTSEVVNVSGFLIIDPEGPPRETYHRDMLFSHMTLCDKPFMGSPLSEQAMYDAIHMARILFGLPQEKDRPFKPVMISNINSLAPLQYAREMAEAMIASARSRQAVLISAAGIMGATSPIRPAGHMAVQSACFLAGLVLTQLVEAGTPVVFGGAGAQMDMQTGSFYNGSPETLIVIQTTAAMAKFYNLPSRSGGGLTDAHLLDFQAGAQTAMSLMFALMSGTDFILHACGVLAAYMSMSFEKFIADEELILGIKKTLRPVEISDETIDLDSIREVGPEGEYLTHDSTLALCRTELMPSCLMNRLAFDPWHYEGAPDIYTRAGSVLAQRFESYRKPDMDPAIENDLRNFLNS